MEWNWQIIQDGLVLLGAAAAYWWLRRGKAEQPKDKAIEWFQFKRVDEDGFIVTEDDRYMMMLKVQPISFALKSPQEQKNIWLTFREWIGMIPHPVRFRVQSHPYNLREYFHEVRAKAIEVGDTAGLEYVQEQEAVFMQVIEEQKIQDQRCYIILETDYRYLQDSVVAGFQHPLLHDLLSKVMRNTQTDNEEVAKQELLNSLRLTESTLGGISISIKQMQREDVLDFVYDAVNREMSSLISFDEFMERVLEPDQLLTSIGKIQWDEGGKEHVSA
ncbi:hypothetical protein [Brevibacillus dissolubilis]|uniref:hypothetical protein n=1 Tax=Brevibacillus dissolubilis TaxID=1844116 RepID=UPI0011173764|nr:hypothetical protein [Brevibacillus dissolubilis]